MEDKLFDTSEQKERIIVVGVATSDNDDTEKSLDELIELGQTAGVETVAKVIQNREKIHPGTYIGKGKIEEVRELVIKHHADTVVCDDELTPAQFNNLSDMLDVKVIDRTVMILDIFAKRASTSEGKLQVELAQLRYRASHLIGGRAGGFDKGLRTLLSLREMGVKDIGFGITVSNNNSEDMLSLYRLSKALNMEFATAAFHNSYYFHKDDNVITNRDTVCGNFAELINMQMREKHPKSWARAFFNMGLINYIEGNRRMLPCEAGLMNCFIDPYGEVYPCNGLEAKYWKESMGNIRQANSFSDIWSSEQAQHVRSLVRKCPKNCWMVGTVSPVMKKFAYARHPMGWIIKNKLRSLLGKPVCLDKKWYDVGQDPMQGNLGRE